MKPPPQIIIIAGPNGAGKSTSASQLISGYYPFVNADEIAKGLTHLPVEPRDIHAGRIMLHTLDELEERRQSFAIETTLANRSLLKRLERLKGLGYNVYAIFMSLHTVELSIQRVAERVRKGGHNIPEETIRRRFQTSLNNFRSLYRLVIDGWMSFDNSRLCDPKLGSIKSQRANAEGDEARYRKHSFNYLIAHGEAPSKLLFCGRYLFESEIDGLVRQAVREAVLDHKAAGNPVAAWKDGKVVIVQPEDIDLSVFDEPETPKPPE